MTLKLFKKPSEPLLGPTKENNKFLRWVNYAVPGMLVDGNVAAMDYAIAHMPRGYPALEIGSFCGLSTVVISYLMQKHGIDAPLFTCDKWEFEGQDGTQIGDSNVTYEAYQAHVKESFLSNMQTFAANKLPYTIECLSDDFFRRWLAHESAADVFGRTATLGGELSFCYIDGNHKYAFAKRDFENTDRVLVPGGFILFDDSADGSDWEVNRLAGEIVSAGLYDVISKNPNYLFRKKIIRSITIPSV